MSIICTINNPKHIAYVTISKGNLGTSYKTQGLVLIRNLAAHCNVNHLLLSTKRWPAHLMYLSVSIE